MLGPLEPWPAQPIVVLIRLTDYLHRVDSVRSASDVVTLKLAPRLIRIRLLSWATWPEGATFMAELGWLWLQAQSQNTQGSEMSMNVCVEPHI